MKKILSFFVAIAFMAPIITVGAVTWTMDSSPFGFPLKAGKITKNANALQTALNFRPASKGVVVIQYSLPASAKGAKLFIYNLSGVQVASFECVPGNNTVKWGVAGQRVATGVYLAALRYGTVSKNIQFSVVR